MPDAWMMMQLCSLSRRKPEIVYACVVEKQPEIVYVI